MSAQIVRLPVRYDETQLAWFAAEARRTGAVSAPVLVFKAKAA